MLASCSNSTESVSTDSVGIDTTAVDTTVVESVEDTAFSSEEVKAELK
jgi:hypothetical protein